MTGSLGHTTTTAPVFEKALGVLHVPSSVSQHRMPPQPSTTSGSAARQDVCARPSRLQRGELRAALGEWKERLYWPRRDPTTENNATVLWNLYIQRCSLSFLTANSVSSRYAFFPATIDNKNRRMIGRTSELRLDCSPRLDPVPLQGRRGICCLGRPPQQRPSGQRSKNKLVSKGVHFMHTTTPHVPTLNPLEIRSPRSPRDSLPYQPALASCNAMLSAAPVIASALTVGASKRAAPTGL